MFGVQLRKLHALAKRDLVTPVVVTRRNVCFTHHDVVAASHVF